MEAVTPEQERTIAELRQTVARESGRPESQVGAILSPYRVCPIGAHVDHQHGPVLGMAIDVGTVLAFAAAEDPTCRFLSRNAEGEASFALGGANGVVGVTVPAAAEEQGWQRYPRAAAWALRDRLPPQPRGVIVAVDGAMAGGGLSSSASLLLGCLTALAAANELEITPEDLVRLSFDAENGYVGLKSGVLDPAAIVASRSGRIACIDTEHVRWESLALGAAAPDWRILVAFSGRSRNLTGTGFNQRVDECRAAAAALAEVAGLSGVERLGDLPEVVLAEGLETLPSPLRQRARHFHEERRRVLEGAACWQAGDLTGFGGWMTDSCRSSIENFETGSEELIGLHHAFQEAGALGSRFSGAGFAGCVVGLVEAERAEACRASVEARYARAFPERADSAFVFVARGTAGVRPVA